MCGLTGFIEPPGRSRSKQLEATVLGMANTLEHRGPDDSGAWVDPEAGVALGFRRLSILDLSHQGHQPMHSHDGRYVLAFNGEIYNLAALRRSLEQRGHRFRGRSDTEVGLTAIQEWGLEKALDRFNGMFALALWDRQERLLHLVRDPLGEKPLYFAWFGGTLLFGSELKALRAHPSFRLEINRDALALYLRHNYIPSPWTIYVGVAKLQPGHLLTVGPGRLRGSGAVPRAYWSAAHVVAAGLGDPFTGSESEAISELDQRLRQAVALRMQADVSVGAFLSGGIDSSAIVALMQASSSRPVKTFTIGFAEADHNEAEDAKKVATHLGTDHCELYVTQSEAMEVIPRLPSIFDEPFADMSQIPTVLVSELARRDVTVVLTGDGGDEVLGGYNRYASGLAIRQRLGWLPQPARAGLARALKAVSWERWEQLSGVGSWMLPPSLRHRQGADKVQKLASLLGARDAQGVYSALMSCWDEPEAVVLGGCEPDTAATEGSLRPALGDAVDEMMWLDTVMYLPDNNLTKVDRATMSVGLEARPPLIDPNVLDFAWRLPRSMKIRGNEGKVPLRQVLYRYVPKSLVDRPKMGFGVPIGSWLRGDLRPWAEDLLRERRLRDDGYFDTTAVRQVWAEHLSGRRNFKDRLWTVLMFQAWLEAETGPSAGAPPPPTG
jgi:asparagine synthase (glutamine-hydrolysing)